mmetsp:Transcript_44093/g.101925  ORF Transcript_44093/g.101925 Transcript_44093/m.101925 type:complete len:354 (+) Transcript_44093:854-1915(+)
MRGLLADADPPSTYVRALEPPGCPRVNQSASCHSDPDAQYTSTTDVIAHLARDWGASNAPSLRAYRALASLLARHVPPRPRRGGRARVLVPGAGACGLAFALAEEGYVVEANDASLPMLSAVRALLSCADAPAPCPESYALHPHVLTDVNVRDRAAQLIPTIVRARNRGVRATEALARLSLQLGSFTDPALYPRRGEAGSGEKGAGSGGRQWDALVSCFVLDALPLPAHEFIGAVAASLRPGGVWLFAGPLAYHERSLPPFSMDEIISILGEFNFTLRARRTLTVEEYAPRPLGAASFFWRALRPALCSVLGLGGPLQPLACARSNSLALSGYEADVFVAQLSPSATRYIYYY